MSKAVWKYGLQPGENRVEMAWEAEVLSVANQGETITMWALVDPELYGPQYRDFYVAATGETLHLPEGRRFIGTVLVDDGRLVWHVFEVVE